MPSNKMTKSELRRIINEAKALSDIIDEEVNRETDVKENFYDLDEEDL